MKAGTVGLPSILRSRVRDGAAETMLQLDSARLRSTPIDKDGAA